MDITSAGHKTICVPVSSEAAYRKLIRNGRTFRSFLDQRIADHPELFPVGIANGYWLHDAIHSKKLSVTTRRIKLVVSQVVYQVCPDFVLPYMVGLTDEVEKALYLRRSGVLFDALAYVFGRDDSYWYRLYQSLGRLSIIGTTVKDPASMPLHLVADEKHSWRLGERGLYPDNGWLRLFFGSGYRWKC